MLRLGTLPLRSSLVRPFATKPHSLLSSPSPSPSPFPSLSLSPLSSRDFTTSLPSQDTWDHYEPKKPDDHKWKGSHGVPNFIENWSVANFYKVGAGLTAIAAASGVGMGVGFVSGATTSFAALYWFLGFRDINQRTHTVRRNFPVLGNIRYFFEVIRPEIRQYLIEGDEESTPFSRVNRTLAYQRAKNMNDTVSLGTKRDVYRSGYEWVSHSLYPKEVAVEDTRTMVGGEQCKQPYSAALLNVSAMSFGALSPNAISALNLGAHFSDCYHNTGEGGISKYHLLGGDVVWNVGTGYFGCRDAEGKFCPEMFQKNATRPQVKMIELKLSQGAKPSKGGMLPKAKINQDIADARGLGPAPWGDCYSPSRHSAFSNPTEMMHFIQKLRELSGGKPVGFKMCMGSLMEYLSLVNAMIETDIYPDFITIDGAEGGTGAAPFEYMNSVGMPLHEGLHMAHSILIGAGIRDKIKIIAAGKVISAISLLRLVALGADFTNAARAMMFALGCIQSHTCNTNKCPTGIATNDPVRVKGLDIDHKSYRVHKFQTRTVRAAQDILGSMGCEKKTDLKPEMFYRRTSATTALTYSEMYPLLPEGCLLSGEGPVCLGALIDENRDGRVTIQEFKRFVLDKRHGRK